jgi:hypothetical protein
VILPFRLFFASSKLYKTAPKLYKNFILNNLFPVYNDNRFGNQVVSFPGNTRKAIIARWVCSLTAPLSFG